MSLELFCGRGRGAKRPLKARARFGPSPDRQRGALLLELMLVIGLSLLLAVWGSQEWAERVRRLQARHLAVWMEEARVAVQAYLDHHAAALARRSAISDEEDPSEDHPPTWSDLQAEGFLPSGWRSPGPLFQTLGLQLVHEGACPERPCLLQAFVHTREPLRKKSGVLDEALIAQWLLAARGGGLVIWPQWPGFFSGAGRRFAVPPPARGDGPPVGTLALRVQKVLAVDSEQAGQGDAGSETLDTSDFLRLRDGRNPDFQGQLSVAGDVQTGARVVANDSLVLEKVWEAGSSCLTEGALGRAEGSGILICRQGSWGLLVRPPGGAFVQNSRRGCANTFGQSSANPVTGDCTCAPGYTPLLVSEGGSLAAPEGLSLGYVCMPR